MPRFSQRSLRALSTCHPDLQRLLHSAIRDIDFAVLDGHRGRERQNQLYLEGRTKVRWPNSKHNTYPSLAVDLAPYPIDWQNRERFVYLAGYLLGHARAMGITLRWGGDWDQDHDLKDNRFDDLVHFELVNPTPTTT